MRYLVLLVVCNFVFADDCFCRWDQSHINDLRGQVEALEYEKSDLESERDDFEDELDDLKDKLNRGLTLERRF